MEPIEISSVVFACTFGMALVCLLAVAPRLPEAHLGDKSKDVVKLGLGLTVAVTSLVLGLMTASVKSSFDTTDHQVKEFSTALILLDRDLREYGKEAAAARQLLQRYTRQALEETWPTDNSPPLIENPASERLLDQVEDVLRALRPVDALHQELRTDSVTIFRRLTELRWTIIQNTSRAVHPLLIVVIVLWLIIIFGSFGLYAPFNATVVVSLLLSSLSIAGCIFLILEMDGAFDGLIRVSAWPLENALRHQVE